VRPVEFLARVRCFGEKLQIRRVRVDSDGYARVWDPIARHYVVTSLSPHQRRRLARLAGRGFWGHVVSVAGGKARGWKVPGRRPVATDRGWKNLNTLRSGRFIDKGRGMQMLFSQPDVKVLFTTIGRSSATKVATAGEAAVCYAKQGYRVLPLPRGARPVVGREPMTIDEVRAHWRARPNDDIGIAMGDGLIAIEITGAALTALSDVARDRAWRAIEEALDRNVLGLHLWDLEICKMQAITSRSMQLLFTVIDSKTITNGTIAPGFDVRSDGAYVVVPPSVTS